MIIIKDHIKINTKRRSGLKLLGVKFLTAHDTGNINTTARQNVNYFKNSADEMSASAHVFIDDVEIIECIPTDEKAWGVWYSKDYDNKKYGVDANDYSIQVELCYFTDKEKTMKAYRKYVDYFVDKCKTYNLNPYVFISGHFQLDPERKTDPMNAFKIIGISFETFLDDVKKGMGVQMFPILPANMGATGQNIANIQTLLMKGGYASKTMKIGVYDETMAQAVLYFQLKENVADIRELANLRGEVIGPKTVAILKQK